MARYLESACALIDTDFENKARKHLVRTLWQKDFISDFQSNAKSNCANSNFIAHTST